MNKVLLLINNTIAYVNEPESKLKIKYPGYLIPSPTINFSMK